ncbi:YdiU family protein [Bradyrhizobium sp. U87765 SZCCT0131]|uniref:protein adenylyltransferase SelO n=1 Tax=unclassified Bradyrhizobium TaxID=2631580 RepID=UPI001BAC8C1D|nr:MULTISPECIES: YdiU family protein [unclassified Bradyrhizobium]MBR1217619.1 YdiU family protein [Bradyrhizobium sp. U87765 SZCCT0131]MBR1261435.1 YdiU family protein [Bradyrhizobium sp. U87765 SZCCT0134]MBR1303117.1 YdiU family protein [Bradyrhizobium sp. U87765 SZCCT0110]MBR1318723.1 YdiU family protein [Bradyrhizobium sp. U87765 SZCCT0109]MBR1347048.1 YdiU family protein [Bradyrhizobium sp. U87765 SZCCT0048]
MQIRFDNSYAALPDRFYARVAPTPVAEPRLIKLNVALADELNLDAAWLASSAGIAMLAGTSLPGGADPIATAYAGHQFGQFVPQLGDGRAILLGEVIDRHGRRRDLQLKGAGPTPFSRRGDGRAALGPVLREYLVSEAMAALGVPTTRALAAVLSGDRVQRETLLPGAVLTRVAASHIRIGTFQFFAARDDRDAIRRLVDHVIARHYPAIAGDAHPARALLAQVIARQADLVARWMLIGFIHGVMNTDNMSIAGETIDYGPCAFMDAYDPATVFSSIDQNGRYAYANQPRIALWNLTRLAECLLSLFDDNQDTAIEIAKDILAGFSPAFDTAYTQGMRAKFGLAGYDGDDELIGDFLQLMAQHEMDFTLTFRRLSTAADGDASELRAMVAEPAALDDWLARWRAQRGPQAPDAAALRAINPAFIPRNHRIEAVIAAATRGDYGPFETLATVLARPYDDQPAFAGYAEPPQPDERVLQTFCGT